jgi:uncharacterized protein (DUF924 family)
MAIDPALDEILNRTESGSEPAAPPAETAATAPAEETAAEDPFEDLAGVPEDTKFDKAYVAKLRKEAASYRTKAKQYESLESYDEADRKVWLQMAEMYKTDPVAAAEYMEAIAKGVKGNAAPAEPDPAGDVPLTRAQVQEMLAERDNAVAVAAEKGRIDAEAVQLGYEVGSRQYKYLLQTAMDDTGGDLKAAHEAIEAEYQARIDRFVGEKARQSDGSPVAPSGSAGAPLSGEVAAPKSFKTATQQLRDFLDGQR